MSTRRARSQRLIASPTGVGSRLGLIDPVDAVALVASSCRERLLSVHGYRLCREDLEDCYSQTTLELLNRIKRGQAFASQAHIAHFLEQRLLSRIHDRRRALSGRSPIEAAVATALPLVGCEGGVDIADARANVERLVFSRHDLRRVSRISCQLSSDQRLVLANQLSCEMSCAEFCCTYGWSPEKYRKVAQRARARLMKLLAYELSKDLANRTVPAEGKPSDKRAGTHL